MTNREKEAELLITYDSAYKNYQTNTHPTGQVTAENEFSEAKRKRDEFREWLKQNLDKYDSEYNPALWV